VGLARRILEYDIAATYTKTLISYVAIYIDTKLPAFRYGISLRRKPAYWYFLCRIAVALDV
jgi:hypothetical protein